MSVFINNKFISETYCMDCMVGMKNYKDNHFDLAIVDCPYGLGESSNNHKSRSVLAKSNNYKNKDWDELPPDEDFFIELKRVSENQIIFGANHFIENIPEANSSCWIVWDKVNGKSHYADCELAYCSFKTAVRLKSIRWHGMLQHDMKNKEIRIHPTQKPVALYDWIFANYAAKGMKILDTHLGSGSSRISANKAGLHFVGYENDKEYYENVENRYRKFISQLRLL